MLQHQAHRALTYLGGELLRLVHDSIFSRVGASSKTGAVQSLERLFGGRPDLTTKAFHPSQLTTSDKAAIRALKSAIPEAHIIPIGGLIALIGFGTFYVEVDSEPGIRGRAAVPSRQADWGAHCMTNVLPYTIKQRN
jgi:hypothetical protein